MNDEQAIITQPHSHALPQPPEPKWKKYAKLIAPHAGLVLACCIYAVIGAVIFLALESPHEDLTRESSVKKLSHERQLVLRQLWKNSHRQRVNHSRADWVAQSDKYISMYTELLFNAFTSEFVRFSDVRASIEQQQQQQQQQTNSSLPVALALKQSSRQNDAQPTKLWTKSTAVFFSATTMATIGYGNIVPATANGRLVCVLFSLIGAPLAIITIGDLGKFMSESTIWLYKQLKALKSYTQSTSRRFIRRYYNKSNSVVTEVLDVEQDKAKAEDNMWDDIIDKTEVPVVLVFAVLLAYIALGAVLFCFIEGWNYIDSFYFCFITLTTVGFGDIVPEEHDYLLIMLLYIGVGLSVTTMCIDLVGIQYIQKIHYFGRKFKGTDFLSYIKRKRMLQKQMERAGISGDEEMLRAFMRELDQQSQQTKDPWEVDNVCLYTPPPESPLSLASTVEERAMLYRRRQFTVSSWTASGPSCPQAASAASSPASVHLRWHMYNTGQRPSTCASFASSSTGTYGCDASTLASASSAHRRQHMYGRRVWYSPTDSLVTFEGLPAECVVPPDTPESAHGTNYALHSPLAFVTDSLAELLRTDGGPAERNRLLLRTLRQQRPPSADSFVSDESVPSSTGGSSEASATARRLMYSGWQRPPTAQSFASCSSALSLLSPEPETAEREWMYSLPHWASPPQSPQTFTFEPIFDLAAIASLARKERRSGSCKESHIRAPPSPVGLVYLESWDTWNLWLEWSNRPYVKPPDLHVDVASSSDEELEPPNLLSPLASEFPITPTPVDELTDSNMGMFELCNVDELQAAAEHAPTVITVAEVPVHSVHSDTVDTDTALETLMAAPDSMLTEKIPPKMVEDNYCFVVDGDKVSVPDITSEDSFWRHTSRPTKYFYSEDLKAFKNVSVTLAKGRLVRARWKDTKDKVQQQQQVALAASTSTEASKQLTKRNSLGKATQPQPQRSRSNSNSTMSSGDGTPTKRRAHGSGSKKRLNAKASTRKVTGTGQESDIVEEQVALDKIFKVTRFYSFWHTCTNFHRIVTLITPAMPDMHPDFKKRIFIQFLWRNAKPAEKERVAKEFDPRKQKLLSFVQ